MAGIRSGAAIGGPAGGAPGATCGAGCVVSGTTVRVVFDRVSGPTFHGATRMGYKRLVPEIPSDQSPQQSEPPRLIASPPNVFALITRPFSEDSTHQQWYLETVVAFDAHDGGAYVVGGLNRTGKLVRLDEVIGADEHAFKIAGVWEQDAGGKEAAVEWAERHIKVLYEDAMPFEPDDPRRYS